MDILNLLKDKSKVVKFLLQTIENSDSMIEGISGFSKNDNSDKFKLDTIIRISKNQSIQIKQLASILIVYTQSSNFDGDMAGMAIKMGKGEEALKQMFENKLNGK